jgi:predicted Zn finger-like uncharacterized protein
MIATCPKCSVRYRIAKEKLKPDGVRMRCGRCEAVFRIRPPVQTPAPAPEPSPPVPQEKAPPIDRPSAPEPEQPRTAPQPEREEVNPEQVVLVAIPDVELAKQTASALEERGLQTSVVHDGVEAMLEVQRQLPRAVLLSASLPKMYGFQVCEVMKRNESLRSIPVILAGSIYHTDRYRREPNEFYGADAYLEDPDLPGGLIPILERLGISTTRVATPPPEPTPPQPSPTPAALPELAPEIPPASVPVPEPPAVQEDDGLAEERAKAERLARIIVSDIVLYNDEKFADAVRRGCVLEKMSPDLEEGRDLFRSRIDDRVCEEQDYLVEELLRVARVREAA